MPPDDSIEKPVTESGGGEAPTEKQPDDKSGPRQKQKVTAGGGDGGNETKPSLLKAGLIVAGLATLGGIASTVASDLTGHIKFFLHWIGLCCIFAGFFAAWPDATPEEESKATIRRVWILGYGGSCVLCLIIAWLVWWPRPEAGTSNVNLEPGNEPFPNLIVPPGKPDNVPDSAFLIETNEVALLLGDFVVSTPERSFTVIKLYGKDLLKLTVTDDRKVRIWADIWDDDGRLLATVEDSVLRVNKNNTLPVLRPNKHTLIIQNERKEDVLSVRLLNPRCIKIGGIFKAGGKYPMVIGDKEITFGPLSILEGMALHLRGNPIFEWPGTLQGKAFDGSEDAVPENGYRPGVAVNNGAINLIIRNRQGEEFSLLQVGGNDVPEGTELWPAISFRLRDPGSY